MRVKLLERYIEYIRDPRGLMTRTESTPVGETINVPDDFGAKLIERGRAEPVDGPVNKLKGKN